MKKDEIRKYLENLKPQLNEKLKEYLTPAENSISLKESIADYLEKEFSKEYVRITVIMTPEELEGYKYEVFFEALNDVDFRKMQDEML